MLLKLFTENTILQTLKMTLTVCEIISGRKESCDLPLPGRLPLAFVPVCEPHLNYCQSLLLNKILSNLVERKEHETSVNSTNFKNLSPFAL